MSPISNQRDRDQDPSHSLTPAEIGQLDVTEPPTPQPVRAWVRYSETPVQVEARAIAWTERAVKVERTMRDGSVQQAWVWRSAVSQRPRRLFDLRLGALLSQIEPIVTALANVQTVLGYLQR
jgi:hypothetical protein